ncbi:PTS system mannose/fructose/sorbose family transporter subunit IID, partial [Faecalibacterium sp. DFI.5.82]|uniref:PTS system mannose/fructose/sorbose family transporter subunit IID n=1 Tax=Faecalibacterium sp. DFI.5.82 TaxID=3031725 RepID=UPI0023B0AF13
MRQLAHNVHGEPVSGTGKPQIYNCTPQTSAFTLGLAASMEEQYAADSENFNPETINAVKTSLMG